MTKTQERDQFIATMTRELADRPVHHVTDLARRLMRYSATLHRLAEGQCNGDYPWDNGERKVEPCGGSESAGCGSYCHRSALKGKARLCPDCRTTALALKACRDFGLEPITQGDPRGCVLKVKVPSGYTDDWSREGVCVP